MKSYDVIPRTNNSFVTDKSITGVTLKVCIIKNQLSVNATRLLLKYRTFISWLDLRWDS